MCEVVDLEKELISGAIKRYKKLHTNIMGHISFMLKTAKIEPIHNLQGLDPSFTSLVEDLERYRDIIEKLTESFDISSSDLEVVSDYISLARKLAESIDSGCSDTLGEAVAALDDKPYI